MIRRKVTWAAAFLGAVLLTGAVSAVAGPAANAASQPSCTSSPTVRCTDTNTATPAGGAAGYYGADDNHTHYRFVQDVTVASPTLFNLNGTTTSGADGGQLCDPNQRFVAQNGIVDTGTATAPAYQFFWSDGKYSGGTAADPCVHGGPLFPNPKASCETVPTVPFGPFAGNICGTYNIPAPIASGDKVFTAIYYTPSGRFVHDISFGACDITQQWCVQVYGNNVTLNLWEFGVGVFAGNDVNLTAPANNLLDQFSSVMVTCYSCKSAVPVGDVQPVNPFGIGGLYEAQLLNGSAQVQMSPNDSLPLGGSAFNVWNGSTTGGAPLTSNAVALAA